MLEVLVLGVVASLGRTVGNSELRNEFGSILSSVHSQDLGDNSQGFSELSNGDLFLISLFK